jgi:hypothetical protein
MTTDVFLFANTPYPPTDVVLRSSAAAAGQVAPSWFTGFSVPVVSVRPVDDDDLAVALALVVA